MDLQALLKQLQAILSVIIRVIKLVLKFVNIRAAALVPVHAGKMVVPLAAQVIVPQVVLLCAELVAAPEDVHQE